MTSRAYLFGIITLAILLELSSCSVIENRYRTRGGRKRFTKSSFDYYNPNYSTPSEACVKFNGVYYIEYNSIPQRGTSHCVYWRFFSKGQICVYSCDIGIDEIDSVDFSKLPHIKYGYYILNSDTLLLDLDDNSNPNFLKTYFMFHIKPDSIREVYFKYKVSGTIPFFSSKFDIYYNKNQKYDYFKFIPLELSDSPNW